MKRLLGLILAGALLLGGCGATNQYTDTTPVPSPATQQICYVTDVHIDCGYQTQCYSYNITLKLDRTCVQVPSVQR